MKPIDLTGNRFGRLIAVALNGHIGNERAWDCLCDCGRRVRVRAASLRHGNTSSCGCQRIEAISTHGLSKTAEYQIWKAAKNRCHNPKAQGFKRYGARGIRMCEAWRGSFETFHRDMGARPSPDHSIERIDNNGPYEPGNCVWALPSAQMRNTRRNAKLTFNNETLTLAEWSDRTGISTSTLRERLRLGWPLHEALRIPPDRAGNRHDSERLTLNGVTKTLPEWARHLNIHATSLRERLQRGWGIERALTTPKRRHSAAPVL